MPIRKAQDPTVPSALAQVPEEYLIFYSSIVDGKPWCPDCRDVDDLVQNTFGAENQPSALMVYVGNKPEWKSPSNVFRGEPWQISDIPTIVKLKEGKEASRLVEREIAGGLERFVQSN